AQSQDRAERERDMQQDKEQRRRDMFRRVNKLDHPIEMDSSYESNVPTAGVADVVVVGSDNDEVNGYYAVTNIKYNGRHVYKSSSQSYLFYVKYKDSEMARWQIGQKQSGIQNDQPIAIVNSEAETPDQIPTWHAWIVFDEDKNEWFRQPRVNTYKADCNVQVSGANHAQLNGQYAITPQTHANRPVFERVRSDGGSAVVMYFDESNGHTRWYITRPDTNIGHVSEPWAFIQSTALTPDGASEFEAWYEWNDASEHLENSRLKLQGTCSSYNTIGEDVDKDVKKKDQHVQTKKTNTHFQYIDNRRIDAAKELAGKRCPKDLEIATDPGENAAIVHWTVQENVEENEDEYDVVFAEGSLAPGSRFPIGKTAVTYSLKRGSDEIAKCDFVVTVKGNFYYHSSFFFLTNLLNKGFARWVDPYVKDNSDLDITLEQTRGPQKGSELPIGKYEIEYKATDYFGNSALCVFNLIVAGMHEHLIFNKKKRNFILLIKKKKKKKDRQAPRIHHCPANTRVEVFEDTKWSAWPEWNIPTAEDIVDGVVTIRQVAGNPPGSQITIRYDLMKKITKIAPGKNNHVEKIVYEALDSSGNAARCTFRIELVRNEDNSRKHSEMHEKLQEQPDLTDNEAQKLEEEELKHHSSEKWHDAADVLKQTQDRKRDRKRHLREERMQQQGGKRSSVHESQSNNNDEAREKKGEEEEKRALARFCGLSLHLGIGHGQSLFHWESFLSLVLISFYFFYFVSFCIYENLFCLIRKKKICIYIYNMYNTYNKVADLASSSCWKN
ncbi:hypothetical protein RFI_01190, partial [Reticulomyxa filosa]